MAAWRGSNSPTRRPGVFVAKVPNGPRYSAGASGLGSSVSRWLHPPRSQTRMIAVGGDSAGARGGGGGGGGAAPAAEPDEDDRGRRRLGGGGLGAQPEQSRQR